MLAGDLPRLSPTMPASRSSITAKEDTGLVRDDFYDWRAAAKALVDGPQHVDVAVIQIGINDDQKFRETDLRGLEPLSKPFNDLYAKRVEELARIFRDKHIPLIWAGLPIMRSQTLSNAALVFNDIDRQYAEAQGAHYVDLWEAFSTIIRFPSLRPRHQWRDRAAALGGRRPFQQGGRPQGGAFRRARNPQDDRSRAEAAGNAGPARDGPGARPRRRLRRPPRPRQNPSPERSRA